MGLGWGPGGRFRSPLAAGRRLSADSVRRQLRRQPVPRHGDRAEDARPRPLHSPALRQPRPPLRGSLAHARFPGTGRHSLLLTAPFRRRPVGSSRNRALPRRTRMALPPAADFFLFNKCLMAEGSGEKLQRTPDQIKKKKGRVYRRGGGAIRSAGRRVTARASRQDAGESAG